MVSKKYLLSDKKEIETDKIINKIINKIIEHQKNLTENSPVFYSESYNRDYDESHGNKIPNPEDYMLYAPPSDPRQLPAPATQADLQRMTFQGEVPAERYEIQGVYRTGAHSVIYKATDKETG